MTFSLAVRFKRFNVNATHRCNALRSSSSSSSSIIEARCSENEFENALKLFSALQHLLA